MNTCAKGSLNERRCADELRAHGYRVTKAVRTKFNRIDILDNYDILALHKSGHHLRFIQVKSNRVDGATKDSIRDLKMPLKCYREVWVYQDITCRRKNHDYRPIVKQRCCSWCDNWFDLEPTDSDQVYCSAKCYHEVQSKNQIEKKCPICNKIFFVRQSESFLQYCSRKCYGRGLSPKMMGANHPHWRGGACVAYEKGLNTIEWKKIRLQVLRRDQYTCQHCWEKKNELHVHHVVPYRISLDNSIENLLTLCESCHMKEEWRLDNVKPEKGFEKRIIESEETHALV